MAGPFDMSADQVEALKERFTPFVNRLLDVERAAQGLAGHKLTVTANDAIADGGVDAAIRDAVATDWLPGGDSAWQFKRTAKDLGPKACADELEGADWAHEFVRNGGSYVLAIGSQLSDVLIERRRRSIAAKAVELGLMTADDPSRVRVYDANKIARWTSVYPALVVSRLAGGPGGGLVDHQRWRASRGHDKTWTADAARDSAIAGIRRSLLGAGAVDIRLQGDSGVGKTRLAMEATSDEQLAPLVAYIADERAVGGEMLVHLIEPGRTAILIVDECPAERHVKLVEQLPADPPIKLITIGPGGSAATRTPVVAVEELPDEETSELVLSNYPTLSAEARRFVVEHSRGNPRWTIVLADRVVDATAADAADLISRNDIEQFIATLLPEGRAFFCSAVLSLFDRVGWDRDLRTQLELLAAFTGVDVAEFDDAGLALEQRGLLTKMGRYRAVSPHPLAVFLAAEAWKSLGARVVSDLLPVLDDEMALGLFRRVADLGKFEPAREVLPQLLGPQGPFASLRRIDELRNGRVLTQLAIVLPDEVAVHLAELIEGVSLEELADLTASRRDLVWTIEKLAWHKRTFLLAASLLLKLAQAENETYSNNATGTWVDLFGTLLPGTAAVPGERILYLESVAEDPSPVVRQLVIKACLRALATRHEHITVSGEIQGGVLVEPRGSAVTWDEVADYRRRAIQLLRDLGNDTDEDIASSAADALISSVHQLLDDRLTGDVLIEALLSLSGPPLHRLRRELQRLQSLYERTKVTGREELVRRLAALAEALPATTPLEEFDVIAHLNRWDLEDGQLQSRMESVVRRVDLDGQLDEIFHRLTHKEIPAAWEAGWAIGISSPDSTESARRLMAALVNNPAAIVGFLQARTEGGDERAFDDFLDSPLGQLLDASSALSIAVRGPVTDRARERVFEIVSQMPVAQAARGMFGWHMNLTDDEVGALIRSWTPRVSSQQDYNAVIDWLNLVVKSDTELPEAFREPTYHLVLGRREYPALGNQGYDWWRLCSPFVQNHADEIVHLVLDLIETDAIVALEDDYESQLLKAAVDASPASAWREIASRIENGSWKIQMEIRGWLALSVPADLIQTWVGDSVERARIVASIAPVGGDRPTEVARFLLDKFGDDHEVAGTLGAHYMSGSWTGPESALLSRKIDQMTAWRQDLQEPLGVRSWAAKLTHSLERQRASALEREAERGF